MSELQPWDFVEKYYPNYTSSDDIARADDLSKLLHEEVNGDAETMLKKEYGDDLNNPHIHQDYDTLHKKIYEEAIEAYLKKEEHRKMLSGLETALESFENMRGGYEDGEDLQNDIKKLTDLIKEIRGY